MDCFLLFMHDEAIMASPNFLLDTLAGDAYKEIIGMGANGIEIAWLTTEGGRYE